MSRLTDTVAEWISETLEACAPGEDADFEVTLIAMPGPQGQPQAVMMVVVTLPSPVLEQGLAATNLLPSIKPQRPAVEQMIRDAMEGLRQARTQMLAPQNGHGAPQGLQSPSGIILPGQG